MRPTGRGPPGRSERRLGSARVRVEFRHSEHRIDHAHIHWQDAVTYLLVTKAICSLGGMRRGVREMGLVHVPWLTGSRRARARTGGAALAVAALVAVTLVNGTPHAAYAATDAPYGGTPAAVPGTVQAANYDTGGQGVAYNVTSVNGTANSYRSDGVDLEVCSDTGCGYDIGWTAGGQWFNYTVDVAAAGTYSIGLRLSSPYGVTDGLHIANAAGANLSGPIAVPNTGGYQDWTTVTASVTLPAGVQTLTADQDSTGW